MNTPHPQSGIGRKSCDLCGLALIAGSFSAESNGQIRHFCCMGCRMVFSMLLESGETNDPSRFKETELYQQCVAAGVVPASEGELAALAALDPKSPDNPFVGPDEDDSALSFQCRVAGMWCPACAWVIQTALARIPGVTSAVCDFSIDQLQCRYDPAKVAPNEIVDRVARLGYTVHGDKDRDAAFGPGSEFLRLIVSALLSVNVMMLSWALYSGFFTELTHQGIGYISWPIFVMTTIVLIFGGGPVVRRAWTGLRAGAPGMETLIVLGSGSAYILSVVNFRVGTIHLYFDTAAMLITLLLLGKWLEGRAKQRVRRDLEGFLSLQPNKVRLCTEQFPDGRYVDIGQLSSGDCIRVTEGDIVPADGRVLQGRADVDVSAITGEPAPLSLGRDDAVISGSRVISGQLDIQTDLVGDDALLGQMIAVVQGSLSQKSVVENRAQRGLALFVPFLVALALITAGVTFAWGADFAQALVRGITVLVVACPCALGIAVPLTRVAGISGAARRGLLVREFTAFDQADCIDSVVFDKTGTLTRGKWTLEYIELKGKLNHDQALSLAVALEGRADHIIARAIGDYAKQRGIAASALTRVKCADDGISGCMGNRVVKIGSRRFATGEKEFHRGRPLGHEALSAVFLSIDNGIQAVFYFNDMLRSSAKKVVTELQRQGHDLHLISGDNPAATRAMAGILGINRFQGGLLPREKAAYIAALQHRGVKTAMVGDGINDAAALAQADLAVAVHSGAALARQVGAVTLMRSDPLQLLDFFNWAQQVNRKIRRNLGWAWIYNLIAIPMAMIGWLTPLVAVTAMLLSSLTVTINTMFLLRRPRFKSGKPY